MAVMGFACPKCGGFRSSVTDSRNAQNVRGARRRRRGCDDCGHSFSTVEILEDRFLALPSSRFTNAVGRIARSLQYELEEAAKDDVHD